MLSPLWKLFFPAARLLLQHCLAWQGVLLLLLLLLEMEEGLLPIFSGIANVNGKPQCFSYFVTIHRDQQQRQQKQALLRTNNGRSMYTFTEALYEVMAGREQAERM